MGLLISMLMMRREPAMPRPQFERRALEKEERRRDLAHRRLHRALRLRQALWALGGIGLLALLMLALGLAGFIG